MEYALEEGLVQKTEYALVGQVQIAIDKTITVFSPQKLKRDSSSLLEVWIPNELWRYAAWLGE